MPSPEPFARGEYVPDDFLAGARAAHRAAHVRRFVVAGAVTVLGLVFWLANERLFPLFVAGVGMILLFAYDYGIGLPLRIQRRLRGMAAVRAGAGRATEVTWDAEGFSAEDGLGRGTIRWEGFRFAVETKAHFVLVQQGGAYSVVPKRWFPSAEALLDFREHLAPLLAHRG
jgi:hypothetical protein